MYCPNCGKELDDNSIFCRYCGVKIDEDENDMENNAQTSPVPRWNNTTLIMVISIVVCLVIMIILIGVHLGKSSTSYTEDDYNQESSNSYNGNSNSGSSNSGSKSSSSFSIEGKWKSVGSEGFGQAQPGSIVYFDGANCNFFSPQDTYAFYKSGSSYVLDVTSYMSSKTLSFTVNIIDNNNIEVKGSGRTTTLKRMN